MAATMAAENGLGDTADAYASRSAVDSPAKPAPPDRSRSVCAPTSPSRSAGPSGAKAAGPVNAAQAGVSRTTEPSSSATSFATSAAQTSRTRSSLNPVSRARSATVDVARIARKQPGGLGTLYQRQQHPGVHQRVEDLLRRLEPRRRLDRPSLVHGHGS